jgi:rhamnogalacturonan endolyase
MRHFLLGRCFAFAWVVLAAWTPQAAPGAETLDRGLVAFPLPGGGTYVGWRLLAEDLADTGFDVFWAESEKGPRTRLNSAPVVQSCNLVDSATRSPAGVYFVEPVVRDYGKPLPGVAPATQPGFISIRLQGNYDVQKVGVADLDGDGRYDYVFKQPNFNTDPYQQPGYWKRSEDTYKIEAYNADGKFLWRYDMGWAIEEGIWYSPIVVYDLDGDGKAEVFCKGGEGDPREPSGHVRSGPEFLVVLDGVTGKVKKRLPWPSREGFDDYNYYSRNLLGIAYLDGKSPHLVVERGTYKIIKVETYDPLLALKWKWEASGEYQSFRGQGAHGMHAADVDGDGRDEVVIGAAVLDDTGKPLWNLRKGHTDVCYVADVDSSRPGLEVFYGIEPGKQSNTVCLVEAKTGKMIWGNPELTVHVHSQGMVGDIDPAHPGMECYAGEAKGGSNFWLYAASGERLSDQSLGELAPKAAFWLDGSNKVYIVNKTIYRWPREKVGELQGSIIGIADCLGDWREEVITSLRGEVRIYSTTAVATTRRVCLMQDRLYRTDVAMQTMGYFYPPQLGSLALPSRQ